MADSNVEKKTNGKIIVIADDTPANLEFLEKVLSTEGHMVFAGRNGTEAIKLIQEKKPDLIILDVKMPDISGFEVCREVMMDKDLARIPVIFVTSEDEFREEKSVVKGLDIGGLDYVLRPVGKDMLLARVRVGLRLRETQKKLDEKYKELEDKYKQIKEMNELMVGRELKMIELEKEIDRLKKTLEEKRGK
ncbi:MAG: response regulator [Candidatus Margulisiibacteriota bacterium]|nr:response regulator [Candidatus Margulisiibacteriota bacterium]